MSQGLGGRSAESRRSRRERSRSSHGNRPGKPSISYRMASHSGFLRRMQERLHLQESSDAGLHPLKNLNAFSDGDPAIALLDAWSTVADVLTFIQERLANEGFIRTAAERSSVLHLTRSVGYEFLPGAAAGCSLAFTVEEAPGSPVVAIVPQGTRVDSIPEPGKMPVVFETVEPLLARAEWNVLLPERRQGQKVGDKDTSLRLKGSISSLSPGDALLFVGRERQRDGKSRAWQLRVLDSVSVNFEQGYTSVAWSEPLENLGLAADIEQSGLQIFSFAVQNASLFGSTAPDFNSMPEAMKKDYEQGAGSGRWPEPEIKKIKGRYAVDLDGIYPRILKDSWIVLRDPKSGPHLCRVSEVGAVSRSDYSLNARVTRVMPAEEPELHSVELRQAVVMVQSEPVQLADMKRTLPWQETKIDLDRRVYGLEDGKALIVRGKRMHARVLAGDLKFYPEGDGRILRQGDVLRVVSALNGPARNRGKSRAEEIMEEEKWMLMDGSDYAGLLECWPEDIELLPSREMDEVIAEEAIVISTLGNEERTTLILDRHLSNTYDPQTMEIFANVTSATHGETANEVIGSGDGTLANQSFALQRKPLTFTSAKNPRGGLCTLQVMVDNILWEEANSFLDMDESSRAYVLKIDENGTTRVVFGDGKRGARLPTGSENIKAVYRFGLGPEGHVPAESLSLMLSRPPGIRSVVNPLAASGAASSEPALQAKLNAPRTLMTLDRIVSLQDYESFARSFVGVGKAKAAEIIMDQEWVVHITICAQDGSQVDRSSELFKNLNSAIKNRTRPMDRFEIYGYKLLTFRVEASLAIDRRYPAEEVKRQCTAALRDQFSFSRRKLAQNVTGSEILACLQKVPGVIFARLDMLALDHSGEKKSIPIAREAGIAGSEGRQLRQKNLAERMRPAEKPLNVDDLTRQLQYEGRDETVCDEICRKAHQILRANPAVNLNGVIEPAQILLLSPDSAAVTLKILEMKT